ncbi:MAG: mechanosensitive ion channel [Flavobacterium sp.]|nr:MAG: mechanosensitive ion channel [Flavobacterium sp.]
MTVPFIHSFLNESVATVTLLVLVFTLRLFTRKMVRKYATVSEILEQRTNLIIKYINILITLLGVISLFVIWGVQARNIVTTLSAVITVIGVALFAQWSVLSNITSGVILFFSFPFRIGDTIRIHDKDFPIEAEIEDIRAFHTILRTADGEIITYPNNLLLQKGISVVKLPHDDREFVD